MLCYATWRPCPDVGPAQIPECTELCKRSARIVAVAEGHNTSGRTRRYWASVARGAGTALSAAQPIAGWARASPALGCAELLSVQVCTHRVRYSHHRISTAQVLCAATVSFWTTLLCD
jgi:hypothetical protein